MGTRTRERSRMRTTIRMGATKFTVETSKGGAQVSFADLNHVPDRLHVGSNGDGTHHATENELTGLARHICSAHGIGAGSRKPNSKPSKKPASAKRFSEAASRPLSPLSM